MKGDGVVEAYYFRHINLSFRLKAEIIHALMRFIAAQPKAVPRDNEFNQRFIAESREPNHLREQAAADPWFMEHIARLFWVCCSLGLLQYQYPYPHKGQTYCPTRAGRLLARAPQALAIAFIAVAYAVAISADPVKHFTRVRNIVTVATGVLLWWRHNELSASIVAISVAAGVVSTWIASFFAGMNE
jgi:hypothetical protein